MQAAKLKMPARLERYFRNHMRLSFELVPAPKNQQELNYIFKHFKEFGDIEYVSTSKFLHEVSAPPKSFFVNMVYNANPSVSLLDPLGAEARFLVDPMSPDEVQYHKRDLIQKLENIVALPKRQFIENDQQYLKGESRAVLVHHLPDEAKRFEGTYTLSAATIHEPFIKFVTYPENEKSLLSYYLQFNVQHFYKFINVRMETDPEQIVARMGSPKI